MFYIFVHIGRGINNSLRLDIFSKIWLFLSLFICFQERNREGKDKQQMINQFCTPSPHSIDSSQQYLSQASFNS